MAITTLEAPTGLRASKEVRVEIIADTVIASPEGRGVIVYKGSVLDVSEFNASMLISSIKAKKSEKEVHLVPNPYLNSPSQKKAN